jgi:hypothetical protein
MSNILDMKSWQRTTRACLPTSSRSRTCLLLEDTVDRTRHGAKMRSRQGTRGALCAPCSRNAGAAQKRFAPKEDRGISAKLVAAIDDGEVWDEAVARARLTITQILRAAALHRAVNELRAPDLRLGDVSRRARV